MLNWRPEPQRLSEKRYGQAHTQVTPVCLFGLFVCVWQVQSPLITAFRSHSGLKVSINHHDNHRGHGWMWGARETDRLAFFSSVCSFIYKWNTRCLEEVAWSSLLCNCNVLCTLFYTHIYYMSACPLSLMRQMFFVILCYTNKIWPDLTWLIIKRQHSSGFVCTFL